MYLGAVVFPKLAILAIYLPVFTSRPYRIACWILFGILVANWFAFTVATCLQCRPLEYLWNQSNPDGHCYNIELLYRLSALPNSFTDEVMLVLPLPVLWKLHSSKTVKIGLIITFATGSMYVLHKLLWTVLTLLLVVCLPRSYGL